MFERIKSKGLYKESDAVSVMYQFLSALAFLHDNNIVHRDLKPENLILASKRGDEIQIADFGLACFLKDENERLSLRCGSPGYVAPEILNDLGYGVASDVFSAGVIFYVMLTGRPVFNGCDQSEILKANTECNYEFPDRFWRNISAEARDLVEKMLTKD